MTRRSGGLVLGVPTEPEPALEPVSLLGVDA